MPDKDEEAKLLAQKIAEVRAAGKQAGYDVVGERRDVRRSARRAGWDEGGTDAGALSGPRGRQTPEAYRPAAGGRYPRAERQETPEERTERYLEKGRSRGDIRQGGNQEADDAVRRGLAHAFSPDWAHDLGGAIGRDIKSRTSDDSRQRATSAAHRYAQFMDPNGTADEEIAANKERIRVLRERTAPRDGGEIDSPDPAERQPIQMQREFSDDAEKEAYLQRIRQAQKNAAGK